jgi:NhaA family Na+:H+ antiporter
MAKRMIQFIMNNSLLLLIGATAGLIWANLSPTSYYDLQHFKLLYNGLIGYSLEGGGRVIDLHYLVNDMLMALFFAMAGKEVWEACLPGGALNNLRSAATPLFAAIGGMLGPALIYLLGAFMIGQYTSLASGWAIPCATDIAFSYLIARLVFGAGHPAIPFLLLLAIADDAMGLIILAVFYPQGDLLPLWLLLAVVGVGLGLVMRRLGVIHFGWYLLIPGTVSWIGFALAGLHPALGLLPIVPTMPHSHSDKHIFDWTALNLPDTLNHFEHSLKRPVDVVLGMFGLLNAGVIVSAAGAPTLLVLAGLLIGKPLGIWVASMFAAKVLKLGLPKGILSKDIFVVGCAASIGFTVALFVATVAFDPGSTQDAAKMGALASFVGAILTLIAARLLKIQKVMSDEQTPAHKGLHEAA